MHYFKFPLIVLLALLLTQVSCHKKLDHTVVEGYVVNRYSGDPISDATIALIQSDPDDLWGFNYHTMANFPVDDNGYFKFEMKDEYNKYDGMYYVGAMAEGYFNTDWDSIVQNGKYRIQEYEKNQVTLKLTPRARIKVDVKKTGHVYETLTFNKAACWGDYTFPSWDIVMESDTSYILCDGLVGDDTFLLHWRLHDWKDGSKVEHKNEIYIPPGGTAVAEIEF